VINLLRREIRGSIRDLNSPRKVLSSDVELGIELDDSPEVAEYKWVRN